MSATRTSREKTDVVDGAVVEYASHGAMVACLLSSDNPESEISLLAFRCAYDADGSAEFAASDMKFHFPSSYCVTIASPVIAIFRYTKLNDYNAKFTRQHDGR